MYLKILTPIHICSKTRGKLMINGNITLHQFEQNKRTHPFGSAEIADKGIYMYI